MELAQNRVQWHALVIAVLNLGVLLPESVSGQIKSVFAFPYSFRNKSQHSTNWLIITWFLNGHVGITTKSWCEVMYLKTPNQVWRRRQGHTPSFTTPVNVLHKCRMRSETALDRILFLPQLSLVSTSFFTANFHLHRIGVNYSSFYPRNIIRYLIYFE
jgi:hypothetical protein